MTKTLNQLKQTVDVILSGCLEKNISAGGLVSRSIIAHKWKTPLRLCIIRETCNYRFFYLVKTSIELLECKKVMEARILIRSALETLAKLSYLNSQVDAVFSNGNWEELQTKSEQLLFGSRELEGKQKPINIMSMLDKLIEKHPSFELMYNDLCETSHPNMDGLIVGFSEWDGVEGEINFGDFWWKFHVNTEEYLHEITSIFIAEYDSWVKGFEDLEKWLEAKDGKLSRAFNKKNKTT